ncbi:MAG TPA: class I SAM-dependent methyltransferase [Gemmatimonadaceae bacterium]|nr:class I SAM-dependent methyltransferase [Gemmatimonadaceae bacterium]
MRCVAAPIEGGRLIEVERGPGVEREVGLGRSTGGGERGWAGGQFEVTEDGYDGGGVRGSGAWDVVLVSQLVHHFPDAQNRELIARVARALKPGGACALLDSPRPASPEEAGMVGAVLDLYFAVVSESGTWAPRSHAGVATRGRTGRPSDRHAYGGRNRQPCASAFRPPRFYIQTLQ